MTCFGLGQTALSASHLLFDFRRGPPDLFVRSLQQLGERQLHVSRDALDFGDALVSGVLQEPDEFLFVQPGGGFGQSCNRRQGFRWLGWCEVAQDAGFPKARRAIFRELHGKQAFVYNLAESVHYPRPVEIDAHGPVVLERVECRSLSECLKRLGMDVPADSLKQRMTRCDPLQVVCFRSLAVRRATRVPGRQRGEPPVRFLFVILQYGWRSSGLERVWQVWQDFQG